MEKKVCVVCGKEIESKRSVSLCCSRKCYNKWWRMRNPKESRPLQKCIICGTEFQPLRKGHICCSQKCRRKRNAIVTEQTKKNKYYEEVQRKKVREAMPESNHKAIADIAIAARAEGLSYGQYEANKRAKMVKIVRKW